MTRTKRPDLPPAAPPAPAAVAPHPRTLRVLRRDAEQQFMRGFAVAVDPAVLLWLLEQAAARAEAAEPEPARLRRALAAIVAADAHFAYPDRPHAIWGLHAVIQQAAVPLVGASAPPRAGGGR